MEKRIELEKRGRRPNQITELNLDNCRSTSIVGLTDEYTALESLSLINVGLTSLKGFPKLPSLKKLELSDNRISSGLNYLTTSPKLQYLNLSGNKIKDFETLKPLQTFKNLAVLDLFNNEATSADNYREKKFEMLPSLKFLDGFDCNDVENPSEGEDDDDDDEVNDDEVNGNDSDDVSDDIIGDEDDDDDENGEETYSDDTENGDLSLADVYNNDLEDASSDWEDQDGVEDEDDDDDSDDDEAGEAAAATAKTAAAPSSTEAPAEDEQVRGKKRKHDG